MSVFHGPRATIIAPPGRTFLEFDADGIHYRIAGAYSQDPFIQESLKKYDETGDPHWKPHVQNTAALFSISVDEAVHLMNIKSGKYTFAKNFIYMLLNGGDVPALANALVSAGVMGEMGDGNPLVIAKKLLDKWLERAMVFRQWRVDLLYEVTKTGCITMPSGRRRRYYELNWKDGAWQIPGKTKKEIFNGPLIMGEVDFMNPRILAVCDYLETTDWLFILHMHDGFVIEGPKSEAAEMGKKCLELMPTTQKIDLKRTMTVPIAAAVGECWAHMEKL